MPYSSARGSAPRIIVLHTGEGILNRFDMVRFLDNNPGASAHAASDAGGAEGPLVPYDRAAWTAGPTANSIGLHVEMCAFAAMTRDDWLSEADRNVWIPWLNNGQGGTRLIRSPKSMLRWTAQWVRSIAAMYNIPLTKLSASQIRNGQKGVCGHADTSAAFGETDHTDPGGAFPWDVFIALCQGTDIQEDELGNWDTPITLSTGERDDGKPGATFTPDVWLKYASYYAGGARESAKAAAADAKAAKDAVAAFRTEVNAKLDRLSTGSGYTLEEIAQAVVAEFKKAGN